MAQETTEEFGRRLELAIDGYAGAPPSQHGRLSWLKRELEARADLSVSVNTVHKWVNGLSKPREDSLRALARLLKVDEIWLSMGRQPELSTPDEQQAQRSAASGAVAVVAGMVELCGGKIFYPEAAGGVNLQVSIDGKNADLAVVTPQSTQNGKLSFVIPEPVGQARVVAVVPVIGKDGKPTMQVEILDITGVERATFGGFSVCEIEAGAKGGAKTAPGVRYIESAYELTKS